MALGRRSCTGARGQRRHSREARCRRGARSRRRRQSGGSDARRAEAASTWRLSSCRTSSAPSGMASSSSTPRATEQREGAPGDGDGDASPPRRRWAAVEVQPQLPSSISSKPASGTRTWKWGVSCSAEPKRWTRATAPVSGRDTPSRLAVRRWTAKSARTKSPSTSERSRAFLARAKRTGMGSGSVHGRSGVRGSTRSTRWMAVSCSRQALQEGHTPRDLQEMGTSTSA